MPLEREHLWCSRKACPYVALLVHMRSHLDKLLHAKLMHRAVCDLASNLYTQTRLQCDTLVPQPRWHRNKSTGSFIRSLSG